MFERYNVVSDGDLHTVTASSRLSGVVNGTNETANGTNAPQTARATSRPARFPGTDDGGGVLLLRLLR